MTIYIICFMGTYPDGTVESEIELHKGGDLVNVKTVAENAAMKAKEIKGFASTLLIVQILDETRLRDFLDDIDSSILNAEILD